MLPLSNNNSEYQPLIKEAEENSSRGCFAHWTVKQNIKCLKIGGVAFAIFVGSAFFYGAADSINTLTHYPISSPRSIYAACLLGFEALSGGIGIGISAFCCKRYLNIRRNLEKDYPISNYTGSLLTSDEYRLTQQEDTKNKKLCLPIIQKVLEELEDRKLLSFWMEARGIENKKEFALHLFNLLKGKGLCFGMSMELLMAMHQYSNLSSKKLMERWRFKDCYYWQLLQKSIVNCYNNKATRAKYLDTFFNGVQHRFNEFSSISYAIFQGLANLPYQVLYDEMDFNVKIKEIDEKLLDSYFLQGICNINKIKEHLKQKSFNQSIVIAGIINLYKEEPELPGHAIFFQISDDRYRFHDSGSILAGFFEFEDQKSFITGLIKQIRSWKEFDDEPLCISIYGIPKAENSSQSSKEENLEEPVKILEINPQIV